MDSNTFFVGNNALVARILLDAKNGMLPHAVLFSGPSGIGKFALAKKVAEILLHDSERIGKNTHPSCRVLDMLWIAGVQEDLDILSKSSNIDQSHRKKEGKRSDTIGIEDLQVLTKFLFETTDDPWKVCIIRNIERFGREAAGTFLKTLEEPPPKTIFLLTTSSVSHVLPTVLSRVRLEKMTLVTDEILRPLLLSVGVEDTKKQETLLRLCGGRPEILQKLMADTLFFERQKSLWDSLQILSQNTNLLTSLQEAEIWSACSVEELHERLDRLLVIWREELRTGLAIGKIPQKSILALQERSRFLEALQKNANKKLLLENFFCALSSR